MNLISHSLKHEMIDTYDIIPKQQIIQLMHNLQQVLTFYPTLVGDCIGIFDSMKCWYWCGCGFTYVGRDHHNISLYDLPGKVTK